VIVERIEPVASEPQAQQQRLYSVHAAACILGLTETALRAQISRGRRSWIC